MFFFNFNTLFSLLDDSVLRVVRLFSCFFFLIIICPRAHMQIFFRCTRARLSYARSLGGLNSFFLNVYLQLSFVVKYSLLGLYDMISFLLSVVDIRLTQSHVYIYPHTQLRILCISLHFFFYITMSAVTS